MGLIMNNYKKSMVAMAVTLTMSIQVVAAEETKESKATKIEQISIIGKRVTYTNNATRIEDKQLQSAIGSVMGLVDNLPGISIEEGDAFGSDDYSSTITMRGFSVNLNEQQLGITIDGLPNGGSNYDGGSKANRFLDSENTTYVDVSQGTADIASASLQALGGTLNFVSNDPNDEKGARLGISSGDNNARRYYARFDTGEFAKDTYAYFSLSDTYNSRWIGTGSNGFTKREHYEAKLISEFDTVMITARLSYDNTDEDNYNGVSPQQFAENDSWDRLTWNWTGDPAEDQNFAEVWSTHRKNTFGYVKVDWQLNDNASLVVTPYYHKLKGRGDWMPPYLVQALDKQGNPTNQGGNLKQFDYVDSNGVACLRTDVCDTAKHTRVSSFRHTHYNKDRYGATAKLNYELDIHQITAGLWLEHQARQEARDWHKVSNPKVYHQFDKDSYLTQFDNTYDTDSIKLSLQDQISWDKFTLSIGVAKYLVELTKQENFSGEQTAKLNSDSNILSSIGFLYDLTADLGIFGGYSKNFSAFRDAQLETGGSTDNLKPETAANSDFGLRFNNGVITASASIYRIEFDSKIIFEAPNTATDGVDFLSEQEGLYTNVGGVLSQGLEASLKLSISDNWSVYSSLTINSSEYLESIASEGIVKGNDVAGSINEMGVLTLSYDDGLYRAGLSSKYTGKRFGDKANVDQIDARTIVDFYAGYHKALDNAMFTNVDLSFSINNISDKRYLGGGIEGFYFIGAPRSAVVTLTLDF